MCENGSVGLCVSRCSHCVCEWICWMFQAGFAQSLKVTFQGLESLRKLSGVCESFVNCVVFRALGKNC